MLPIPQHCCHCPGTSHCMKSGKPEFLLVRQLCWLCQDNNTRQLVMTTGSCKLLPHTSCFPTTDGADQNCCFHNSHTTAAWLMQWCDWSARKHNNPHTIFGMEALVQQHGLAHSTQWDLQNQGQGSWAGLLAKVFGRPAQRNKPSTFA